MMKEQGMQDEVRGLGWLVSMVVAGTLLLAAGAGTASRTAGDPSIGGRLASLVTCVLPQTLASPSPTRASASETMREGCGQPPPYRLSKFWIAC
jgi:hypothetical protein